MHLPDLSQLSDPLAEQCRRQTQRMLRHKKAYHKALHLPIELREDDEALYHSH
jgi:hypothetical protein